MATVEQALEAVRSGPLGLVVEGPPGIGKTTVWQHGTVLALDRDYRLLSCRPNALETPLSFSALADLMDGVPERILDALPRLQREALDIALLRQPPPESGFEYRAICVAVRNVVRNLADDGPVVIAVDDAQWLDKSSDDVLRFVARRLGDAPVLVLVSVRREREAAYRFDLDGTLAEDRLWRVRLGGLDLWSLYRLVLERTNITLSRPDLLRLAAASGGNPFFAIEIARASQRPDRLPGEPLSVPPSLTDLVADRLRALPAKTRLALLYSSALAHATTDQVRVAMGELDPGLFDAAEDGGIVVLQDGHVRFTHPLLSSTVYASAPRSRQRAVHRRLAEVVANAEERAWQMALAVPGPDARVAAALETAAAQAQHRGALAVAARLWDMAGRRTPDVDRDGAHNRTVAASQCLFTAGDTSRARMLLESAIDAMAVGRERAHAMLWLASILYYDDSPTSAVDTCRRALVEAGDDVLLRAALHLRASWFAERDTCGRVLDAERAVDILDRLDMAAPADLLAASLITRGHYRFLAGYGTGWDDLTRARALLPADGRSWECEWGRSILAIWFKSLDQVLARAGFAEKYRRAVELGDEAAIPHALVHLAEIECWQGEWPQAMRHATEASAAVEQTGQRRWRGLVHHVTASLHAHVGQLETARELAERSLRTATEDDDPWVATLHLGVLGFVALSGQDLPAADRYLSRADDLVTSMGLAEPARYRFHADHVEAVLGRGDIDRARELLRRLEIRTRAAPYPWLRIVTARCRALLCAAEGDLAAAVRAAEQALEEHQDAGLPFEHGRSLLVAGRIRRRRKEKLLARQVLLKACDIFGEMGAPVWLDHARTELGRLGVRRETRHDLTPTEERVATMVTAGMTNRQVAGALFISEKTVEANLSRIFRKLGIRSRRELHTALHDGMQPDTE